jgi:hypothetical protein
MKVLLSAAVAMLGLASCTSPLYKAEPAVFQGRPRLAIVAFDAHDWSVGTRSAADRSRSVDAAHQAFLAELTRADLQARDMPVAAPCEGDLGDLCKRLSVSGLSPVNLTPAVARAIGANAPADLLVEVHLLPDIHVDSFWSLAASQPLPNSPGIPQATLFVRAFDAQGKQVWEDQQVLSLPFTLSRDTYLRNYDLAVLAAARQVVARLVAHTTGEPRHESSARTASLVRW